MSNTVKSTVVLIIGLWIILLSNDKLLANTEGQGISKTSQVLKYVLKEDGQSPQMITLWKNQQYLAVAFDEQQVIGLWQNWNSGNPTFYQVYPKDRFRIEFSRMESQQQGNLLHQLKRLVGQERILDNMKLEGASARQLHLAAVEEGADVTTIMDNWARFATYDYADIGDNEAIPELARLIHQGFVSNF